MKPDDERAGEFDVFLSKGDGTPTAKLPLPPKAAFRKFLMGFVTDFEFLGCPDETTRYRLGKWKDHGGDDAITAKLIGLEPDAIRKMIDRLYDNYKRHQATALGLKKKP